MPPESFSVAVCEFDHSLASRRSGFTPQGLATFWAHELAETINAASNTTSIESVYDEDTKRGCE